MTAVRNCLAACLLLGGTSLAGAADMAAAQAPVPAALVAPASDWTGFYAGVHAGYRWGGGYRNEFGDFYSTNGALAGPYAGFNWQLQRIVVGLEADWGWTSNSLSATNLPPNFSASLNSLGSVRGRLGVALDRFLVYGTAGVAFASQTYTPQPAINTAPSARLHAGWVAGLGVEAMLTPNLVARVEYLRADPGSRSYDIGLGPFRATVQPVNIIRAGIAYRFSWGAAPAVVARY